MLWSFVGMFVSLFVLVVVTGVSVDLLHKHVIKNKSIGFLVMSFLIGLVMSLPELSIAISSSWFGIPELAIGNILGSNIVNLSLVMGGVALVIKGVSVVGDFSARDLWFVMALVVLPLVLMVNGGLSVFDGVILLICYGAYLFRLLGSHDHKIHKLKRVNMSFTKDIEKSWFGTRGIAVIVLIFLVAVMAGSVLVMSTISLTQLVVSDLYFVGVLVLALVTTLPELGFLLISRKKKMASLVLSGVLGGMVFNSTLIIGLMAVSAPFSSYDIAPKAVTGVFLIALMSLFWLFATTKKRLDRWEGLVLIGVYLMFACVQIFLL
jgi:cation:H+ antiporter